MKKILFVVIAAVAVYTAYHFLWKKEDKPATEKQKPVAQGENTGVFNQSFQQLLNAYYGVKDALVASDTAKASAAALVLATASDSLKVNEIEGDSTGDIKNTALSFTNTISGSARLLAGEAGLKAKRKEFEMIATAMWPLMQTVRYKGEKVYWQFCPMAKLSSGNGAYWMSNIREIRNPYFGDEMLECGETQDSLDFAKK
jgi:uncharacterized protein DUF3347